jgi:hypothetical protein
MFQGKPPMSGVTRWQRQANTPATSEIVKEKDFGR